MVRPPAKVEHKVTLTGDQVAQWVADVGKALNEEGTVSVRLADSGGAEVPRFRPV